MEHKKKPVVVVTAVTRATHCQVTISRILCIAVLDTDNANDVLAAKFTCQQ